jgi:hypothetical protein
MLSREQIKGTSAPLREVDVPEWGGAVALRALGPLDLAEVSDQPDGGRRTVVTVRCGVADGDGKRLFTPEDDVWLADQPWSLMLRLATAISEHSGIGASAETAPGN